MILFFLAYIATCLYGIKIQKNPNNDYLSVENTQAIKGIFILLVFFSHFNSYVTFTWSLDSIYQSTVSWFGQTMVTLFLFYSGYGVMESINKKGLPYIKSIPVKRVLSTLFKFDCAVIIFWIIGALFGNTFSPKTVALSLIGWDSLGNSNWYIFVVLLLYLFTFVSFRFLPQKTESSLL